MGKQHIIELNGKRYDVQTGHPVTSQPLRKSTMAVLKQPAKSLDGFSTRPHALRKVSGTSGSAHAPQKAQTLMRTVVSKPVVPVAAPKAKPITKAAAAKSVLTDKERLERAKKTPQSHLIRHFGAEIVTAKAATVKKAAAVMQATGIAAMQRPTFHKAVAQATSHQQPKTQKAAKHHRIARKLHLKPKTLNIGAMSVALLLVVAFFTYQNIPNLAMRVASMRAQVDGSLPSYKPSGFSLNGAIQYKPGQITLGYKSNSDDRNFQITQRTSGWDSQSLLENYVTPKNTAYQTVQDKGKTVYLYDGGGATWVDGGIWYTIEGQSKLNSQQLQDIAASL